MKLEELVVQKLKEKSYIVTTAESCTGGLLSGCIINVSGVSSVYNEGYITYANESKMKLLGVSKETLEQYGAVSEQTAEEMARGAAKSAKADVALSVTGIAGPDGGTPEKPVGLVYVGCCIHGEVWVRKCNFSGTREENRKQSVEAALQLLLEHL